MRSTIKTCLRQRQDQKPNSWFNLMIPFSPLTGEGFSSTFSCGCIYKRGEALFFLSCWLRLSEGGGNQSSLDPNLWWWLLPSKSSVSLGLHNPVRTLDPLTMITHSYLPPEVLFFACPWSIKMSLVLSLTRLPQFLSFLCNWFHTLCGLNFYAYNSHF